jgi:hypothetical protein
VVPHNLCIHYPDDTPWMLCGYIFDARYHIRGQGKRRVSAIVNIHFSAGQLVCTKVGYGAMLLALHLFQTDHKPSPNIA